MSYWQARIKPAWHASLRWWCDELVSLIPDAWRQRVAGLRRRLIFAFDQHGAYLAFDSGGRHEVLGRIDLRSQPAAGVQRLLNAAPRSWPGGRGNAIVSLPARDALSTTLNLPLAVEHNLAAVIGFEFERVMPFQRAETYYAYEILGRDKSARRIRVKLTVVPRERAEERFEFVRRSGFQVAGLRIVSQEPPFAATSIPLREPPGIAARPHRFVVTALSACTALLAIACVALPFVEASRAIHDLTERVADAKRQAAASVRLQKEIADQVGDRQSLALRRQKSLAMTELLDIVTRLTPDDTWLTELQVSGRELHLTGVSVSATALLGLIDQSPSFRNATFRSSITQDPQLKRERFDISATIAPREPR